MNVRIQAWMSLARSSGSEVSPKFGIDVEGISGVTFARLSKNRTSGAEKVCRFMNQNGRKYFRAR